MESRGRLSIQLINVRCPIPKLQSRAHPQGLGSKLKYLRSKKSAGDHQDQPWTQGHTKDACGRRGIGQADKGRQCPALWDADPAPYRNNDCTIIHCARWYRRGWYYIECATDRRATQKSGTMCIARLAPIVHRWGLRSWPQLLCRIARRI